MNTFTIVILGLYRRFGRRISLFERSPFEVPLVPSTLHLTPSTLQAGRFGLVALQTFGLAGDTSWRSHSRLRKVSALRFLDTPNILAHSIFTSLSPLLTSTYHGVTVPLRLLDCFGLLVVWQPAVLVVPEGGAGREGAAVAVEGGETEKDKGGSRIADGDGILMFSMPCLDSS